MSNIIKIVLADPSGLPQEVFTDGEVVIDTNEVSGLAFNKQISELNDVNKLRVNGATGTSIPYTKKNRIIFAKFLSVNNMCLDFEPLSVNVFMDGIAREEDWLQFVGFTHADAGIEIELVNSKQHWLNAIEDKVLTDINFDALSDIELTWENLVANWDNFKWEDNSFLGYFPLINYGQKRTREIFNGETSLYKDVIFVNDFRPLISVLGTIKQMFCQEGWEFRSPVLESDYGRRLWMYALKEDYYKTEIPNARGRLLNFRAEFVPAVPFLWQNDIYNNDSTNGNFDLGNVFQESIPGTQPHYWKNPLPFAHRMKFGYYSKLKNPHTGPVVPTMHLHISSNGPGIYDTYSQSHAAIAAGADGEITGEFEIVVNPGDWVQFDLEGDDATLQSYGGSYIYGTVNGKMYYNGDFVSLSDAVHPYSFLDFFKGTVHLFNGKLKTDWATKTVWLYPEENVKLHDVEDVEGFLRPAIGEVDITNMVVSESMRMTKPLNTRTRIFKLKFKDSTDPYVIDVLGAKETLHSKVVDFGNKYNGEVVDENPFFEPTPEAPLYTISTDPGFYPPIHVPIMTDNVNKNDDDQREVSYGFGPRIFYAVGNVAQQYYNPISGTPYYLELQWRFEENFPKYTSNPRYTFPYVTQLSTHNINATDDQVNQNVVFGEKWFDLFSMFHQKQIIDTYNIPPLEFLLKMDTVYFENEDFRKRKFAIYDGQPMMLIPDSIRDFRPDAGNSNPATFRVDRFVRTNSPCSCKFQACTMYMDIKDTISDSTLTAMRIVSFKLDGVQFITDPVSLGPTAMIEVISGINYVTNLRDAINSVGVPWFRAIAAVNPPGNPQPVGRRGKYIRLEWPGCQTFEIIVDSLTTGDYLFKYDQYGFWIYNSASEEFHRLPKKSVYSDFRNYNCSIIDRSENLCL